MKKGTTGLLCADQIDLETWFFPVCMKRLHAKLRKHHRLKHHSRVNYKSQFYFLEFYCIKMDMNFSLGFIWLAKVLVEEPSEDKLLYAEYKYLSLGKLCLT